VRQFASPAGDIESPQTTTAKLLGGPSPIPNSVPPRRPLANIDVNAPLAMSRAPSESPTPLRRPLTSIGVNAQVATSHTPATDHLQTVDPAILGGEELAELAATVSQSGVQELHDMVFSESTPPGAQADHDGEDDVSLHSFDAASAQAALASIGEEASTEDEAGIEDEAGNEADNVMNPASASPASPKASITAYSKINKVSLSSLARHWNRQEKEAFEKVLHAHCLSGGSRDDKIVSIPPIYIDQ
jgi:hypothetical protein